jgi:hypothetical protein
MGWLPRTHARDGRGGHWGGVIYSLKLSSRLQTRDCRDSRPDVSGPSDRTRARDVGLHVAKIDTKFDRRGER